MRFHLSSFVFVWVFRSFGRGRPSRSPLQLLHRLDEGVYVFGFGGPAGAEADDAVGGVGFFPLGEGEVLAETLCKGVWHSGELLVGAGVVLEGDAGF